MLACALDAVPFWQGLEIALARNGLESPFAMRSSAPAVGKDCATPNAMGRNGLEPAEVGTLDITPAGTVLAHSKERAICVVHWS